MLSKEVLKWLNDRKSVEDFCCTICTWEPMPDLDCDFCMPKIIGKKLAPKVCEGDFKDAAGFEARVAQYLATHDYECVPCAHSMKIFCPRPPFAGRNCGDWCRLRSARLFAEESMPF